MSLEESPPPQQSPAAQLPREIISHIFSLFESSKPTFDPFNDEEYSQKILGFGAVCQSWRGSSLQMGKFAVRGADQLDSLLDMLTCSNGAGIECRAIEELHFCGWGERHAEQFPLVRRLLQMSTNSLRVLYLQDGFYYTMDDELGHWKQFLDAICTLRRLQYLKIDDGIIVSMDDILRYVDSSARAPSSDGIKP